MHRAQSEKFGTRIFSETVTRVDLLQRPFRVWTSEKEVAADTIILATGASRLLDRSGKHRSHLHLLQRPPAVHSSAPDLWGLVDRGCPDTSAATSDVRWLHVRSSESRVLLWALQRLNSPSGL